jgi:hypothetical protein
MSPPPLQMITFVWFYFMVRQPPVGQGFHIFEVLRSRLDTPFSVGILWKIDQHDAGASTSQHTQHSQKTETHTTGGNRNRIPSKRKA